MESNLIKYTYSTENIKEGERYDNFKSLFFAVTGCIPPTGKRNLDIVKKNLNRWIEYIPESQINPNAKKRSLVVTKVYESPLPAEENRGKRGRYADYLYPLILGTEQFRGKMIDYCDKIGLFRKYRNSILDINQYNQYAKNIWSYEDEKHNAVKQYKKKIWHQQRSTIKHALDALQNEKLLTWNEYYMIIPDVLVDINESSKRRLKSRPEASAEEKEHQAFINGILKDENSVLNLGALNCLNIYSSKWNNSVSLGDYCKVVSITDYSPPPLLASEKQASAIDNFELFLRQYVVKTVSGESHFRPIEDIPNEWDFFENESYSKEYKKQSEYLLPILTGCKAFWKEFSYKLSVDGINRAATYDYNLDYSTPLTVQFILYMDEHLCKFEYYPKKSEKGDIVDVRFFSTDASPVGKYKLNQSKSALELHSKLKELYEIEN